jgi:hypothetical protein
MKWTGQVSLTEKTRGGRRISLGKSEGKRLLRSTWEQYEVDGANVSYGEEERWAQNFLGEI